MTSTTLGLPRPIPTDRYDPDELSEGMVPPRPIRTQHYASGVASKGMDLPTLGGSSSRHDPFSSLVVGCLLSLLVLIEGLFVLGNMSDPVDNLVQSVFLGMDVEHPLHCTQWVLLTILAFGDVLCSLFALTGLVLTRHKLLVSISVLDVDTDVATVSVGAIFGWRIFITIATAPWVGSMLAFAQPGFNKGMHIFGTLVYIALSSLICWVLVAVSHTVTSTSQELKHQQLFDAAGAREEMFRRQAHDVGQSDFPQPMHAALKERPQVFGCVPLHSSVFVGTLALCVLSFTWFVRSVNAHTIGGWAFPLQVPRVAGTSVLEFVVYTLTMLTSMIAVAAQLVRYFQDEDYALYSLRWCAITILAFLIMNVMRFALFVPITGMVLAAKDVCGFYAQGLSSISTAGSGDVVPLHCTADDWTALMTTVALTVLDGCFTWGIYQLWQKYRTEFELGNRMAHKLPDSGLYGSTEPGFPVRGFW